MDEGRKPNIEFGFALCLALCAVCAGVGMALAEIVAISPLAPPRQPGVRRAISQEELYLVFGACISFYGTAFTFGRLLFWWFGATALADEVREAAGPQLALLNLISGGLLIAAGGQAFQQAVAIRPSFVVGAVLFVVAAYDGWIWLCRPPLPDAVDDEY